MSEFETKPTSEPENDLGAETPTQNQAYEPESLNEALATPSSLSADDKSLLTEHRGPDAAGSGVISGNADPAETVHPDVAASDETTVVGDTQPVEHPETQPVENPDA